MWESPSWADGEDFPPWEGGEGQLARVQLLWNQEMPLSALPSILGILHGFFISCLTYLITLFSLNSVQACLVPGPQLLSSPCPLAVNLFSSPSLWQRKLSAGHLSPDLPPTGPVWALVVSGSPQQQPCPASPERSVAPFL